MFLSDVKLNTECVIKEIYVADEKIKTRLMELGLINGCIVKVKKKSVLKKTFLIIFNSTCFTLKDNLAREIMVEYA